MFPSLTNALEGCGVTLDEETLHFITETPYVSANPIVVYYLVKCLKDKSVCFLALQNTWSHYNNIANKLGVNLRNKVEDGTVKVIEASKILPQLFTENDTEDNLFNFLINDKEHPLKDLYFHIKNIVHAFQKGEKSVAIIIDSVTPLLHMGVELNQVDIFIQYCSNLVSDPKDILVLSCSIDESDSSSKQLSTQLFHKCPTILSVKGLSTGTSKNIHGELNIYVSPRNYYYKGLRCQNRFHFKLEERDIKVFSPGLASNTL